MGFLKFLVWTAFSIGLGVFLASYEVGGRTPLEHATRAWKERGVGEALDRAKDAVSAQAKHPKEYYSSEDRAELNRLLGRRAPREK